MASVLIENFIRDALHRFQRLCVFNLWRLQARTKTFLYVIGDLLDADDCPRGPLAR